MGKLGPLLLNTRAFIKGFKSCASRRYADLANSISVEVGPMEGGRKAISPELGA